MSNKNTPPGPLVHHREALARIVLGEGTPEDREFLTQADQAVITDLLNEVLREIGVVLDGEIRFLPKCKSSTGITKNPSVSALKEQDLSPEIIENTLAILETRFKTNSYLHEGCSWDRVKAALEKTPKALLSLIKMEEGGHEPDVYLFDEDGFYIGTCSKEVPISTRGSVYDMQARKWVKVRQKKDVQSAVEMAEKMGITLMSGEQYMRGLQDKSEFDEDTISWLLDELPKEKTHAVDKGRTVPEGRRRNGRPLVSRGGACEVYEKKGWRGSFKVNWV